MIFLRQSTASQEILLGPFVDSTDGDTAETGLTIANTDIQIWKSGATTEVSKNSGGATHIAGGRYYAVLDATDTNTVGGLEINVHVTGALAVKLQAYVLEEAIYDALFAAGAAGFDGNGRVDVGSWLGTAVTISATTSKPEVDVNSISDDATAANNAELFFDGTGYDAANSTIGTVSAVGDKSGYRLSATGVDDIWDESAAAHVSAGSFGAALHVVRSATAQGGTTSSVTLDTGASASDNFYNNQRVFIVSGTGAGQGSIISAYTGATRVASIADTWVTAPDNTSVFVIMPFGSIPGATAPSASTVAAAVWDRDITLHTAESSAGSMLQPFQVGTAQAGTASSITLDATGASATTDFYRFGVIEIIDGTGVGQSRQISAYNGTTAVATVAPDWTTTPDNTSRYVIKGLGIDASTPAQVASEVWDTPRASHITAGTFGEYVLADAIRVSGSAPAADGLEAAVAGTTPLPSNTTQWLGQAVAAVSQAGVPEVDVTFVGGVAQDLPTATALATVDANVDAILVDTGTTIPGILGTPAGASLAADVASNLTAINALNDVSISEIFTTAMTESYAAAGAAPSLAQALFAIYQQMQDATRSGTTLTVRNLAGASAFTMTLDDGANPTDINRAT